MLTPIEVLYALEGHTDPESRLPEDHPCSHCHKNPGVVATKEVLSHNFTQWDTLEQNIMPYLCNPCAWSYSSPQAKRFRLLITQDSVIPMPHHKGLALLKSSSKSVAMVFAIQGQKQLLPNLLQWGTVTTDVRSFLWNTEHSEFFELIVHLKELGLNEKDLTAENPAPVRPFADFYISWSRFTTLRSQHSDLLPMMTWLSRKSDA